MVQRESEASRRKASARRRLALRLPLPKPYHSAWVFSFLAARAVDGVEAGSATCWRRRIGRDCWIEVALCGDALRVAIPADAAGEAEDLLARVRRVFDLDADATAIDAHLATVPMLRPLVEGAAGIRVPGVWDAYEGAARAILGQQVSVARATRLAILLCERFGAGAFPSPGALAGADVPAIGIPGVRGRAVSEVARRVDAEGDAWLLDAGSLRQGFAAIRGIGPWTTEYAAMRVSRDADAFPDSDWGVHKVLGVKGAAARKWAEPCRPWRAYATMLLWQSRAGTD